MPQLRFWNFPVEHLNNAYRPADLLLVVSLLLNNHPKEVLYPFYMYLNRATNSPFYAEGEIIQSF